MKQGQFGNLMQLAQEIDRRHNARKDFIADTTSMRLHSDVERNVLMSNVTGSGMFEGNMKQVALRQLTQHVGIPTSYHNKLVSEAPQLLDQNVNHWLQEEPKPRMVRTLDGTVDAFLSNRYKRIDNYPIAEMVLPVLHESGVKVESCDITDTRMYLKVVSPKLEGEVKVGDPVQMGVIISNSEVGLGALDIRALIYRLVCLNGMVSGKDMGDGIRRTHLGARQDYGVLYAEDTIRIHGQAISLQVRDTVQQLLSEGNFRNHLEKLKESAEKKVTGDPVKAIEQLGKVVGFNQEEGTGIMRHLIEGGDLSQWGLVNAVTRFAQDVSSYDRSTELETIGGKIIELAPRAWKQVAEAA